MNGLYVVEPRFSITGGMADHRLKLRSADIEGFALSLAAELGKTPPALSGYRSPSPLGGDAAKFVAAVAKDLAGKRGAALVIPGERQSALTHAVAHAINAALGAVGTTVTFTEPAVLDTATGRSSWGSGVDNLRAGKVDTLVIAAWNPVFTAPGDVDLPTLFGKVPNAVYLGLHDDETSRVVNWFLPLAHAFESWGDARSRGGRDLHRAAAHPAALRRHLRGRAAGGVPHRRGQAVRAAEGAPRRAGEDRLRHRVGGLAGERRGAPAPRAPPSPRSLQTDRVRAAAGQARPAPAGLELDLGPRLQGSWTGAIRWEQLAPGASGPDHEGDLGQRGEGRAPGWRSRWGWGTATWSSFTVSGRSVEVPAWVQARPRRRRGDRLLRLRAQAEHPRREGRGRASGGGPRRVPAAHRRRAVVRDRARS